MNKNTINSNKRKSVQKNYELIAEQYGNDFGTYIEDIDIYKQFEKHLVKKAQILDLGAGTGRTYSYFNKRGYHYIGLDFSQKMQNKAYKIHGKFSYIVDDMTNLKKYFSNSSIDGVFAVYSLFHLPNDDLKKLFSNVYDILKSGGIFLFSYQIGKGEEMVDEPYLSEKGKQFLYMNYHTNDDISKLLKAFHFQELFRKEKIETSSTAINKNKLTTVFILIKK